MNFTQVILMSVVVYELCMLPNAVLLMSKTCLPVQIVHVGGQVSDLVDGEMEVSSRLNDILETMEMRSKTSAKVSYPQSMKSYLFSMTSL